MPVVVLYTTPIPISTLKGLPWLFLVGWSSSTFSLRVGYAQWVVPSSLTSFPDSFLPTSKLCHIANAFKKLRWCELVLLPYHTHMNDDNTSSSSCLPLDNCILRASTLKCAFKYNAMLKTEWSIYITLWCEHFHNITSSSQPIFSLNCGGWVYKKIFAMRSASQLLPVLLLMARLGRKKDEGVSMSFRETCEIEIYFHT